MGRKLRLLYWSRMYVINTNKQKKPNSIRQVTWSGKMIFFSWIWFMFRQHLTSSLLVKTAYHGSPIKGVRIFKIRINHIMYICRKLYDFVLVMSMKTIILLKLQNNRTFYLYGLSSVEEIQLYRYYFQYGWWKKHFFWKPHFFSSVIADILIVGRYCYNGLAPGGATINNKLCR